MTVSVLLGQDANWDLRNYHLYDAYALLSGRFWFDQMPAGPQSNLNPLLDVPYYLLAIGPFRMHPRLMAAAAGLPFGALLFATAALARWVLTGEQVARDGSGLLLPWIAAAIGGSAAATASEIGTTMNDIQGAVLIVGALAMGGSTRTRPRATLFLAGSGAMLGTAVALKLTNAVFGDVPLAVEIDGARVAKLQS